MESERLVSADGLREWIKKIPLHDLSDGRGLCRIIFAEDFERAMASFPGEAIQIVRCKDCDAWKRNVGIVDSPNGHCFEHDIDTNGQDFCSYGEQKGGDNDNVSD